MARFVSYKCPDCGGVFRHLHHPSDAPPPDRCELCGSWMSDDEPPEAVFVPQAPGIRKSAFAASVDQTYRAQEAASIERADHAVSMLESEFAKQPKDEHSGAVLADFQKDQIARLRSDLKVTNMKDPSEMRAGDTAAVLPSAAVAEQNLSALGSKPGFQQGYGARPAGAGTIDNLRTLLGPSHSSNAAAMVRAGQMGSYRE